MAATCLSGKPDKQELNLTGPEALDHAQVAAFISEVSDRAVSSDPLTEDPRIAGARAAGVPESATGCAVSNPMPYTPTWKTVIDFLDKHMK